MLVPPLLPPLPPLPPHPTSARPTKTHTGQRNVIFILILLMRAEHAPWTPEKPAVKLVEVTRDRVFIMPLQAWRKQSRLGRDHRPGGVLPGSRREQLRADLTRLPRINRARCAASGIRPSTSGPVTIVELRPPGDDLERARP